MGQRYATDNSTPLRWFTQVILIVLVAAISLASPSATMAQTQTLRGTSFTTGVGQQTIAWNNNWNATLQGDDDFSTMVMLDSQIMIYAVMFIHDPLTGLDASAVYHSLSGVLTNSFDSEPTQTVEWEGDNGAFHGLNVISLSGIDFALYLRVDPPSGDQTGPTMQLAAAPVRAFPTSLDAMQEELSINDRPVMEGSDGEEIMAMLGNPETVEEAPAESAADDEAAEEAAPAPARSRRDLHAAIHDSADPAGGEFESAANDYTVTYDASWQDMAESDATVGEFSLIDSEPGRTVVSFTGRSTTETNREAYFEDIVARESRYDGFVGSSVSDDRLLVVTWTSDNELAVLEYVFVDDNTLVTVMVTVSSSNPESGIAAARGIQLDGADILQDWDDVWPED